MFNVNDTHQTTDTQGRVIIIKTAKLAGAADQQQKGFVELKLVKSVEITVTNRGILGRGTPGRTVMVHGNTSSCPDSQCRPCIAAGTSRRRDPPEGVWVRVDSGLAYLLEKADNSAVIQKC